MTYDVAIIGGGASGVATAILCARRGLSVIVIEHNDRILKKVLATGNGKCNFSNIDVDRSRYNTDFVSSALDEFDHNDAIRFFESLGMMSTIEDGRLYPYSKQASTVVFALMNGIKKYGIKVVTETTVKHIDAGFTIATDKNTYHAKSVVMATGSNATTGLLSHYLAKEFSHNYNICTPSLTYLTCDKGAIAGLAGIRIKAEATIEVKGAKVMRSGELLFKNNALSGIMIFELSSFFARHDNTSDTITINMAPDMRVDELYAFLNACEGSLLTKLTGLLPKQLAILVDKLAKGDERKAIDIIHGYKVKVTGLGDIKNAQVVSGGLRTEEFNAETLESKKMANFYAVGEVLDVDGECGGYNLHWAWASANLVAKSIGEKYGK